MTKHAGQIIEEQIRKSRFSITEIAIILRINRRTIYNFFNSQTLRPEYIIEIGRIIRYDFSQDFPEIVKFNNSDFDKPSPPATQVNFWKDKYIELLEKYNELLLKMTNED